MVKDFRYIIKRIIIGVGIAIVLSFLRGKFVLQAYAQTNTYNATTSCVFSSSSGSSSEVCKTPPNTVVGGDEVNIWFTQSTLLQPSTTYFLEFRVKIIGLDTNVQQFNSYGVRATNIYTGNNGTASSIAYPDRNENFSFYHTDRNTAYLVWTFELDSLSTFNTIRISFFTGSQVGSIGGVMYTHGGIESATLRITGDQSSSGGSTTFDDTGIINNANDNANNIINNNNQNTQNIIDSQNNNTQSIQDTIVDNNQSCSFSSKIINSSTATKKDKFIGANGNFTSNTGFTSTEYIPITSDNDYTLDYSYSNVGSAVAYCLYTSSKVKISCTLVSQQNSFNSGNARYLTVSVRNGSTNKATLSGYLCQNKIDKTTDSVKDMNDTLKDETGVSNSDLSNLFDDIDDGESNSPVSDLLTMPLTLLNAYVNGMSGTCSAFNLGSLFGTNLTFPCITISDYLGSSLWSLIDSLFCIFMIYNIGMLCISIYESITSLQDSMQRSYTFIDRYT